MPISAVYNQRYFRFRNDDGSETTATWVAAEDTNVSLDVDTNYRVRLAIAVTTNVWISQTFNLYYSKNGGAYTAIGSGQAVNYAASSNFAQGDDTTRQLSAAGNFLANNNGMCESAGATNSGSADDGFEVEFSFQIDSGQVVDGDTITLRLYRGTTALDTYTVTPSITVVESGGSSFQSAWARNSNAVIKVM